MSRGFAIACAIVVALGGAVAFTWSLPVPDGPEASHTNGTDEAAARRPSTPSPSSGDPDAAGRSGPGSPESNANPRNPSKAIRGVPSDRPAAEQTGPYEGGQNGGTPSQVHPVPSAQPGKTPSGAADEPPEGFRDQESSERADWLEGRMEDFLLKVQPELQESGMSRSCTASGRSCTFEGPMSDDFVRSWLDALAYGAMSNEGTLQGVEFSELAFIETDDGRNFSITAKHPSAD